MRFFKTLLLTAALLTLSVRDKGAGAEGDCQKLYAITASTKEGLRYGFIDPNGRVVAAPQFVSVEDFSEGVAVVRIWRGAGNAEEGGRAASAVTDGIINSKGELIVPADTHILSSFSEGLALATVKGKFAYIDKTGGVSIRIPDELKVANVDYSPPGEYHFYGGVAALRAKSGGVYVIDKHGDITFSKEPFRRYDECGLAVVDVDGKVALVDGRGNYVVGPQEHDISGSEGVYIITPTAGGGKYRFINAKGEALYERAFDDVGLPSGGLIRVKTGGKWGYMDKSGKLRIPAGFEDARDFAGGLAAVKDESGWGFIGQDGTFVIPPRFEFVRDFDCDLAYVKAGRADGYIDREGKWVWKSNQAAN